ncbi:MAG: DNA-primase RepB domain-containing protein [Bryobacteraceae bacterium]
MIWHNSLTKLRDELAQAEAEIRAGKEPLEGLLLWYADWSQELKLMEKERAMRRDAAAEYIKTTFEPSDRLAVVLLNRTTGETRQRIATAEKIAEPNYQAFLRAMNAAGTDIHISMNALAPGARGRTKDDIAVVRHVYLDVDRGGKDALARILGALPPPNHVLNTSPDKYQLVWRVQDFNKPQAEDLMRGMAAQHGADPAATDCSRVLRLPGFRNHKYEKPHYVGLENRSAPIYRPEHFPPVELVRPPAFTPATRKSGTCELEHTITQSHRDWNYALRHLGRLGESPETVRAAIERFRADKPDPAYYAKKTVDKAMDAVTRWPHGPER